MKNMTCITFWVEGEIPEDYDWNESLPEGVKLATDEYSDGYRIKSFPWSDVYHEVNWWITRPMALKEWDKLDNLESNALASLLGDDFMGTAGPIPFDDWYEEAMKIYESEKEKE